MKKEKIAIVNPMLGYKKTGAGPRSFWIIEALKDHYDLFLITIGNINFELINAAWGTKIKLHEVNIIKFPQFFLNHTNRFTQLKYSVVGNICKKISKEFDVMFSTYNVMDFGKRGIQYIGDFLFLDKLREHLYNIPEKREKGWFYKNSLLRKAYLKIACSLYSPDEEMIWRNLTLVNSKWSQRLLKQYYGINSEVVYPPVIGNFINISWDKKETGFICLANLVPFKQIERAVTILSKVRNKGFDIHLHLIGRIEDSYYAKKLIQLCSLNKEWCYYEGEMYGEKKLNFISQHKFGINCCQNEAFGIAIAEMVNSGAIVWVPNGGGQVEIVDHPMLIYKNEDDAVKKIIRVLKENSTQVNLRSHLANQAKKFSTEVFMKSIRNVIKEFSNENKRKNKTKKCSQ
jgi:glycosyltransferase involved in cell wall biosynthesis